MTPEESTRLDLKDPEQMREYKRTWMATRRAKYMDGKACVDCGATENLEIDHRDPAQKTSHRIWSWSHDRILHELAKCDVRCHDCHVARHESERPAHGISAYKRKGCRCEICRAAKAAESARYKVRKGM